MISPPADRPASAHGVVRLLNTAGGPVLCLAGRIDAVAVEAFVRRYGREPVPIHGIDAGSVTWLSTHGLELLLDHLHAAGRAGRRVTVRRSLPVERLLTGAGVCDLGGGELPAGGEPDGQRRPGAVKVVAAR